MNLFYQPLIRDGQHWLDPEESRHCRKVLRKKAGDIIDITDGKGKFYKARLSEVTETSCKFAITETTDVQRTPYRIEIAISPTKNADRLEWFVEKSVEIGVHRIIPLICEHTERVSVKRDRLEKIAVSAMKQSLRATLPEIEAPTSFANMVLTDASQKFIAFVDNENPLLLNHAARRHEHYLVLIGPEGDFTSGELASAAQAGFVKVSLGKARLRTETAGLVACHMLNLLNG